MVMTTEPTWADESFPLWRLPRLQFFGLDSPGKIKLKTAVAASGQILNNPDGTGKTYQVINRLARGTDSRNPVIHETATLPAKSRSQIEA
jgi:hypothetical protein